MNGLNSGSCMVFLLGCSRYSLHQDQLGHLITPDRRSLRSMQWSKIKNQFATICVYAQIVVQRCSLAGKSRPDFRIFSGGSNCELLHPLAGRLRGHSLPSSVGQQLQQISPLFWPVSVLPLSLFWPVSVLPLSLFWGLPLCVCVQDKARFTTEKWKSTI